MSDIETGGRAFPWCGDLNDCPTINLGMTLRDYFAANAMQSLIIAAAGSQGTHTPESVSGAAYETADAMLKARKS